MTLDEEYPVAGRFFQTPGGFMKGDGEPLECVACGRATVWFHRGTCLYFCSTHCFENYDELSDGKAAHFAPDS